MSTLTSIFSGSLTRRVLAGVLIVLLALACKYLWQKDRSLETLLFSGETMATTYHIKVVGFGFSDDRKTQLAKLIEQKLVLVNEQMSPYHKGGDIFRVNEARTGQKVRVGAEVMTVLKRAAEISEMTNGAFDVTVGPLIRLWGFHDKKSLTREPENAAILKAQQSVGFRKLILNEQTLTVEKSVEGLDVDLSAIAKGRAVDMVAEALDGAGEQHYMVEVGGEIRCRGKNDRGKIWQIGIEKPNGGNPMQQQVSKVIPVDTISLATSGDYRSYYMMNGRRYSHTLNPGTGRPIEHSLASVSVLTKDCMTADALATGFTVLGTEEGKKIADKHGIAAYFIERNASGYSVFASREFVNRFSPEKE